MFICTNVIYNIPETILYLFGWCFQNTHYDNPQLTPQPHPRAQRCNDPRLVRRNNRGDLGERLPVPGIHVLNQSKSIGFITIFPDFPNKMAIKFGPC